VGESHEIDHQIKSIAICDLIAAPLASFAQSSEPATSAQGSDGSQPVQAKRILHELDWMNYPANTWRAEALIAEQNNNSTAYGAATSGTS
jgi:hypothetical protein